MSRADPGGPHGPLPRLLLVSTLSTGMIDTFTYLELGQVFVAAMTGNLVFLGLGLTGLGPLAAPAVSVSAYAAGAYCGGRLVFSRSPPSRAHLMAWGAGIHAAVVGGAALVLTVHGFGHAGLRTAVVALLALSMGWQYSLVRRLKVPDVTTTVVTTTMTNLFGQAAPAETQRRRALMIGALLCGVLLAGLLRRVFGPTAPLWTSGALLATCAAGAWLAARSPGAARWNRRAAGR